MKWIPKTLPLLLMVMLTVGCPFAAKKPITYYQGSEGSDFPDYKQGPDGKYYVLDKQGNLIPPNYAYREDMQKMANQGAPIVPQGPGVTNYANVQATQAPPQGYSQQRQVAPAPPTQQQAYPPQGYAPALTPYPQQPYQPQPYVQQPGTNPQVYYQHYGQQPYTQPYYYPQQPAQAPVQGYAPYAPAGVAVATPPPAAAPRKIALPTNYTDNDEEYELTGSQQQPDYVSAAAPQILPPKPAPLPTRAAQRLPDINQIYRQPVEDVDEIYKAPSGLVGGSESDNYNQMYDSY